MRQLLLEISLDLGKCSNYKLLKVKVQIFFPMSESSLLIKSYISIVKKIAERLVQYLKKVKSWISHGIFQNGLSRCRGLF